MQSEGFQLIELILVLALVSAAALVGVGAWRDIGDRHRLETAAEALEHLLHAARTAALTAGVPVEVRIDGDLRGYLMSLKGESPALSRRLPEGVSFEGVPSRTVTFYSRGHAAPAGSYFVVNRKGTIRVVVTPAGRVRRERVD